jgi:hypothetical protein
MKLIVEDLPQNEADDLVASSNAFSMKPTPREEDKTYVAITVLVIAALTKVAIYGLAAWLLKNKETKTVRRKVVVETSDGNKITMTLTVTATTEQAAKAEVLKQVNEALKSKGLPSVEDGDPPETSETNDN